MGEALTIEVRHEQGYAIVTAAGEIDISTATKLRECLFELAASGRPLVADLDQVASSTPPGFPRWSARPSAPPRTAAAYMRSAPGRRPASCSA